MKQNTDNLIYFKFEKDEFLELRKTFLSVEKSLLEILKSMKEFNIQRKKEFSLKNKFRKSLKNTRILIGKTISFLPKINQKKELKDLDFPKDVSFSRNSSELDMQLQEIKNKLERIGK